MLRVRVFQFCDEIYINQTFMTRSYGCEEEKGISFTEYLENFDNVVMSAYAEYALSSYREFCI